MPNPDIAEKHFTEHNDIFCDLVNMAYFDGEPIIKPESLTDLPARQLVIRNEELGELERDVCKSCKEAQIELAIYGLENQSNYDRFMPIRTLEYNAWCYMKQVEDFKAKIRKNIVPVITLVVSFSTKKWNKNHKLSDLLKVPDNMKPYFNDYKINLLELAFLTEEQIAKFKTPDMRAVAGFLRQKRLNVNYVPSTEELIHTQNVIMVISALNGDKDFVNVYNNLMKEGKEPKSMCEMIERIKNEARAEGKTENAMNTAKVAISMGLSITQIMALTNLPEKTILQLMCPLNYPPTTTIVGL